MVSSATGRATRITTSYSVKITTGRQSGDGHVYDLSGNGCAIQSAVSVRVGDMLQLRIIIPEADQSLKVRRALVRWVEGCRFGVEFRDDRPHARLHHVVHAWKNDPWKLAR